MFLAVSRKKAVTTASHSCARSGLRALSLGGTRNSTTTTNNNNNHNSNTYDNNTNTNNHNTSNDSNNANVPKIGWHYLSNVACLTRPPSFCASSVASRIIIICYIVRHF